MDRKKTMSNESEIFERMARALRKFTTSVSAHILGDCWMQALLAQSILQEEGIITKAVVGEAAWRIGRGDSDVIAHSPRLGGVAPEGVKALAFHAWLEMGDTIIDFTTHTLRMKAQALDDAFGGQTSVLWCPPYLVMPRSNTVPLDTVTQALKEEVACYEEIPGLLERMIKMGLKSDIDITDRWHLRMIFDNPDIRVIGPNDLDEAFKRNVKAGS